MADDADSPAGDGSKATELYNQAKEYFESARYREAIRCLSALRSDAIYGLKANANIGSCLLMMGLPRAALHFLDRALLQDPTFLPALLSRLKALNVEQRHGDVTELAETLVGGCPQEEGEEVWRLWVASLRATAREEQALEVVGRWLSRFPQSLEGHLQEAELLSERGDNEQAVGSLGRALRIAPDAERVYSHLSVVMVRMRRHEAALQYVDKALEFDPESFVYHCRRGRVLQLTGDWRGAASSYAKVAAMRPHSAIYQLNQHLMLPGIPASREEIEEARRRFLTGLSLVESSPELWLDVGDEAIPHTFELAYHNHDDRRLLERYIDLMRRLCEPLLQSVRQCQSAAAQARPAGEAKQRLRIGFLSRHFSGHSNAIAFSGLIRHLDRQRFEVVLIHTAHSKQDTVRNSLDAICEKVIQLSEDVADAYLTLVSTGLDILFFTDLGMNPYEFILPFLCTAPIQITGWGIPHTSGIREIDYYISAAELEPPGAEEQYTETLIRLPGALPCYFEDAGLSLTPLPREYFFLPPGDTLVGCLQGLHKLHPDFDLLMEKIAQANPEAAFVFVEDSIPSRTRLFLDRLSRTAPSVRERCIPLAFMGRAEYHALCNCLDLLLDPIYYGSGITFFEACFVGTPIVTLEGSNLRSRVVACGYREMGIDDPPIAANEAEYVRLVSELCYDSERRNRLKAEILANNHRVFNRIDYIRNFEAFCVQAMNTRHQKSTEETARA
jgi:predicted O-linked N-acetylglucosamine transferase (SPINDLY family)